MAFSDIQLARNGSGYHGVTVKATRYVYDSLNRLTTETSSVSGQFTFGYDALSRRSSLVRPNGVNTSYAYDALSRLLSVTHQAGGATVDGAGYAYDNAGNRIGRVPGAPGSRRAFRR